MPSPPKGSRGLHLALGWCDWLPAAYCADWHWPDELLSFAITDTAALPQCTLEQFPPSSPTGAACRT